MTCQVFRSHAPDTCVACSMRAAGPRASLCVSETYRRWHWQRKAWLPLRCSAAQELRRLPRRLETSAKAAQLQLRRLKGHGGAVAALSVGACQTSIAGSRHLHRCVHALAPLTAQRGQARKLGVNSYSSICCQGKGMLHAESAHVRSHVSDAWAPTLTQCTSELPHARPLRRFVPSLLLRSPCLCCAFAQVVR